MDGTGDGNGEGDEASCMPGASVGVGDAASGVLVACAGEGTTEGTGDGNGEGDAASGMPGASVGAGDAASGVLVACAGEGTTEGTGEGEGDGRSSEVASRNTLTTAVVTRSLGVMVSLVLRAMMTGPLLNLITTMPSSVWTICMVKALGVGEGEGAAGKLLQRSSCACEIAKADDLTAGPRGGQEESSCTWLVGQGAGLSAARASEGAPNATRSKRTKRLKTLLLLLMLF